MQYIFVNIAKKIPLLTNAESVVACFEALGGVRQCRNLQKEHPSFCNPDDAKFIDENSDWTSAKHWAQWWTRSTHF